MISEKGEIKMTAKIEVFYTGGGITIAEADIDDKRYAVVTTEAPEFFSVYNYDADEEKTHLPDDMLYSVKLEEIPPELRPLYAHMVEKLKTA